ncbi:MAG TPA: T9SS type A sorting domain-containing protein [Bacteroidia bacterium]|jgi:hypothetical protein|nr:T9SS type A sorting domain-containing protein [Bacteroidia bacterium]
MKNIFTALFLAGSFAGYAQQSTSFSIPCSGVSADADPSHDWFTQLNTAVEADQQDEESDFLKDSVRELFPLKQREEHSALHSAVVVPAPVVGTNFAGNNFNNSTPCDNEVAIANNGHLISVQNSNIFRYRTVQGTAAGIQSLGLWSTSLGLSGTKYDPKVIYDPEADRFIMVCLAGYTSGQTNIVIGFSRTDTCNGLYNLYKLPGNPYSDSLWTDYPMMAVNNSELFITGNLLHDNMSWQTGFVQTVIWQLNKWDGYNGDTLRTELHGNIALNGRPIRNLCPVEGGATDYAGPGMYFLSDRNLDVANDTVFLVHVTDTANSVNQQVTVTPLVSSQGYGMPANARENGGDGGLMATNDSRILGAFIQNDRIQYVNNTMDTSTGRCAVYHGIIQNVSTVPTASGYILGDTSLEFGYPNIAYVGYGAANDNNALIFFLHTDSVTSPGNSIRATDGNGNYSVRTPVKLGSGYIDVLSGDERWGDYSGIQRKYDVGGTCWVNGMYGNSTHSHGTWVAKIGTGADVGMDNSSPVSLDNSVFPNPFSSLFHVSFINPQTQIIRFAIYDSQGRLVQVLLEDEVMQGKTDLSFSTLPLAPGTYFLRTELKTGEVLFTEKIVRQ